MESPRDYSYATFPLVLFGGTLLVFPVQKKKKGGSIVDQDTAYIVLVIVISVFLAVLAWLRLREK